MSIHHLAAVNPVPAASLCPRAQSCGGSGSVHSEQRELPYNSKIRSNFVHPNSASELKFTRRCRYEVANRNDRAALGANLYGTVLVKGSYGTCSVQGSGRAAMEDTKTVEEDASGTKFFAVFDGHGGKDVSEYLQKALWPVYKEKLAGLNPVRATVKAFAEVDKATIAAPKGLFGAMRQRGMGGAKCGSTAATLLLLPGEKATLVAANVGDSRIVLCRAGTAVQLSVDHKPDLETERKRIEAKNPTPRQPLVQNIDGVWRVGGLLALSRAFGDVYLKDWSDGVKDGARGGFGLTAEPSVVVEEITTEDTFVILGTDGLFDFVPNQVVVDMCLSESSSDLDGLATKLVLAAQAAGSTDDVTAIVVKLS